MSYVLDALKKADAERERGAVPGLHAQPMPGLMDAAPPARSLPGWVWLLAGATIVLLVLLAWLVFAREATRPAAGASLAVSPPAPMTQAQAPVQPHTPQPAQAAVAVPRAEPQRPRPAEVTPKPSPERASERNAVAAALPPLSHVAGPAAHATREAPRASAASAVSPAASRADEGAEGRIYAISELPEDVRRALPRLSVGGSIYSDNPAGRFVIINGQVFHENDRLAPDLTLEQIRLKLAVLRYKDVRFRIMF